jgi:hypothetical protein
MNDFDLTPNEPAQVTSSAPDATLPDVPAPDLRSCEPAAFSPEPAELFQSFSQIKPLPPSRIPHLGHLALLAAFLCIGFVCMMVLLAAAVFFHLDGVSALEQIKTNVHYLLGSEGILYLVTFILSFFLFPLFWKKSFFAGVHWRTAAVPQYWWQLPLISLACIALAGIDEYLLPGPKHAPIEDIIRSPGAAWMMFAFGVTIAPFFEELVFRGFLLPAFCTAFDWIAEHILTDSVFSLNSSGRPQWSPRAIIFASLLTGIPFLTICYLRTHMVICILILALWCLSAVLVWALVSFQRPSQTDRIQRIDEGGQPLWSLPAMVANSIFISLPFALMHGEQTGYSLGPFLQVFAVSLILCAVRLKTRSLAASTLVHACYNFFLFSAMLVSTGGFQHLDKM